MNSTRNEPIQVAANELRKQKENIAINLASSLKAELNPGASNYAFDTLVEALVDLM